MTISKDAVYEYLEGLNNTQLHNLFKDFVEYKENCILEDEIFHLENKVDELEELLETLQHGYE